MENLELNFDMTLDSLNLSESESSILEQQFLLNNQDLIDDIEKLKINYENYKTENELLKLSNSELKNKICELYKNEQLNLNDKNKLDNLYKDLKCQSIVIENSSNWYKKKFHESEAINVTLKCDIETYEKVLLQREKTINDLIQKSNSHDELIIKYNNLHIKHNEFIKNKNHVPSIDENFGLKKSNDDKKINDESNEYIIRIKSLENQLQLLEKKYLNSESSRCLIEESLNDCRKIILNLENNIKLNELKNIETIEKLKLYENNCQVLNNENKNLNLILLSSKKEQCQIEEGIINLRIQLTNMIAQYRSLKLRNNNVEKKLLNYYELIDDNKKLKKQIILMKNSYQQRVNEEINKSKIAENLLNKERDDKVMIYQRDKTINSMKICLYQSLEREKKLKEHLKLLAKGADESVDEGYADGGAATFDVSITSPVPIDPSIVNFAAELISKSDNFLKPLQPSIDELRKKIETFSKCFKSI